MPVLTTLSQFEQYDIETEMCDVSQISRESAGKILAAVIVPELEKRIVAAVMRALLEAAGDMERAQRIAETPLADVPGHDLEWYRAPEQSAVREVGQGYTDKRRLIADWLRARALRSGS